MTRFLKDNYASSQIESWKGDEIVAFQEDLFEKVKARVSEKWFYTYIKKQPQKLPRIDILNLLSAYSGYENWNAFVAAHSSQAPSEIKKKKVGILLVVAFLGVMAVGSAVFFMTSEHTFSFCLVDEEGLPITHTAIDIKILLEGQSPVHLKTDSTGCFSYVTVEKQIRFVMKSPYHKTDTIVRDIGSGANPNVQLQTDDYALMLHYYSNGNVSDWKKRKAQLERLIADDAEIYQVFRPNVGVELYSKEDFIRKLTIPTSTLKNIRILDKRYRNGKIVSLKFVVE